MIIEGKSFYNITIYLEIGAVINKSFKAILLLFFILIETILTVSVE